MPVIRWTPAMSVGLERIDRDHKVLLGLINRVGQSSQQRGGDSGTLVGQVLDILISYTQFHFSREEATIEAGGYPDSLLQAHRQEHHGLANEVQAYVCRYQDDPTAISREEMLTFLTEWLNHHILLQDKAFAPYVGGNPAAIAAAEAYGDFDFDRAPGAFTETDLETT